MKIEVRVPQLPESLADALLISWHRVAGDSVVRDENLADLETDKVVLEIPAPEAGQLSEVKVGPGTTVTSGMLVAIIDTAQVAMSSPTMSAPPLAPQVKVVVPSPSPMTNQARRDPSAERVIRPREPAVPVSGQRRVLMSPLRSRIASRLVDAQNSQAPSTLFDEVDLSALNNLRASYTERFEKHHGVRLGLMAFFVKATVQALGKVPMMNAAIDGDAIVYHDNVDIGVAVATERGLIVPVLRHADKLSFPEIEQTVAGFAERARSGSIRLDELLGGTFTVTNAGVFGARLSTPIVSPPQSAILGMHTVQERPIGVDGKVVLRPMMHVALTYDHRLIDDRDGVEFLVAVKASIEDPARLLLGL